MTDDDIEKAERYWHDVGFDEGYQEGFEEGYGVGFEDGYADAHYEMEERNGLD